MALLHLQFIMHKQFWFQTFLQIKKHVILSHHGQRRRIRLATRINLVDNQGLSIVEYNFLVGAMVWTIFAASTLIITTVKSFCELIISLVFIFMFILARSTILN
jgi:hypothetical protein